jgi:MazG family protein
MTATPIEQLLRIIKDLRSPGGCPWDIEQTPQSISHHIIEEAYELVDAIESKQTDNIIDELSDQLLHVVMISEMMSESGAFNFYDVATHCATKMLRRHPHIFDKHGNKRATQRPFSADQWEKIKSKEHPKKHPMDGIPNHLPALIKAEKTLKRAQQAGFDCPPTHVSSRFTAIANSINSTLVKENLGKLLFYIVNLSRIDHSSAESALNDEIKMFKETFISFQKIAKTHGKSVSDLDATEKKVLWDHTEKYNRS